ncbi:glycoside hydrolase [Paenibacillus lemnae]|uniref:Glycoside hydrolase n=2 Tax=Paenibacillus lemnae TaxID=1330551 RepID=A0A848M2A9_PAELE|nr:glycoside hydrolase [Paenibacillus lemnae]
MMQQRYFDQEESIARHTASPGIEHVLTVMAQRYIGSHPMHGPVYRVTRKQPIRKGEDHRYIFPGEDLFPEDDAGQHVYAWGKLWIEEAQSFIFTLSCLGPVKLHHNGIQVFGSSSEEEDGRQLKLKLSLTKGWNHMVLELGRGQGAVFGTSNRKNFPYHFLAPSLEREGEEGWLYTRPTDKVLPWLPDTSVPEAATGMKWLPEDAAALDSTAEDETSGGRAPGGQMLQLYGHHEGAGAYAWTKVSTAAGTAGGVLTGTAYSPIRVLLNGEEVYRQDEPGAFHVTVEFSEGKAAGDLFIYSEYGADGWGFSLEETPLTAQLQLQSPRNVLGAREPWLYLGPLSGSLEHDPLLYAVEDLVKDPEGDSPLTWRTAQPEGYARPFLENELFGRWNYPLGVTLYGLLTTGQGLSRPDYTDYVRRHVEFATSAYEYSLWDRETFGAAGLNNQLSHIDSLDDCGSFGALAILADRLGPLKGAKVAAEHIAQYILSRQDRLPDGALYRRVGVSVSMNNTMWCDDMYMSVPFLCRYAELSGNPLYLSEAADQLLLYKKYLYMQDRQIMSHVYDVAQGKPTLTPWGRGNGWVFFSLTELLAVLPEKHPSYEDILVFYRELAEGYLALQDEEGMWHQVLTDHESYPEASCTSMFMFGFARGVRCGWLEDGDRYKQAAISAWEGLCRTAIDKHGNLYGVCRGSSYSFTNHYYKHELGWRLNDTHGIGIVMLAGMETRAMLLDSEIKQKLEHSAG